jgi:thiol-disulfide isomerase/thioredoxin
MQRFFVFVAFSLVTGVFGQSGAFKKIPLAEVKNLQGKTVSSVEMVQNGDAPVILSFWATWCKPCVTELNAIKEVYEQWQEETGVKLVAVSIDDPRNAARVKPFVHGQMWEYEIYIDENSDLRRAMNVNNIPHTFLLSGSGEVLWQHTSYIPGDEDKLYQLVLKVAKGESIK